MDQLGLPPGFDRSDPFGQKKAGRGGVQWNSRRDLQQIDISQTIWRLGLQTKSHALRSRLNHLSQVFSLKLQVSWVLSPMSFNSQSFEESRYFLLQVFCAVQTTLFAGTFRPQRSKSAWARDSRWSLCCTLNKFLVHFHPLLEALHDVSII